MRKECGKMNGRKILTRQFWLICCKFKIKMENQVEKKKRGGRREGAGRKKTTCKTYGFNAPEEVSKILESTPNKTDFIIQAILEKHQRGL